MTPDDITRLDELHAKTTQGWPDGKRQWTCKRYADVAGQDFVNPEMTLDEWGLCCELYNAWPAISAELTRLRAFEHAMHSGETSIVKLQAELATLREFEAAVREAMTGAKHDYERVSEVSIAIDDIDRKRGENNEP